MAMSYCTGRTERATNSTGPEAAAATNQVISSTLLSIGVENVLCGKRAFLILDQRLLS